LRNQESAEERNSKDKVAKDFNIVGDIIQLPAKKQVWKSYPSEAGRLGTGTLETKVKQFALSSLQRSKMGTAPPPPSFPP
jgi:hypothetical protein